MHYPYKEPLARRNKESPECHFNLAFQGGGAKGVSYVGVYKALKELHSTIPISSVIGSSAGGILALAISSGMTPSGISDLCL
jgi:predicted acylesterase/phospholipase RssA